MFKKNEFKSSRGGHKKTTQHFLQDMMSNPLILDLYANVARSRMQEKLETIPKGSGPMTVDMPSKLVSESISPSKQDTIVLLHRCDAGDLVSDVLIRTANAIDRRGFSGISLAYICGKGDVQYMPIILIPFAFVEIYNRLYPVASSRDGEHLWRIPFWFATSQQWHPLLLDRVDYHRLGIVIHEATFPFDIVFRSHRRPELSEEKQQKIPHHDAVAGVRVVDGFVEQVPQWQEMHVRGGLMIPLVPGNESRTHRFPLIRTRFPIRRFLISVQHINSGRCLTIDNVAILVDNHTVFSSKGVDLLTNMAVSKSLHITTNLNRHRQYIVDFERFEQLQCAQEIQIQITLPPTESPERETAIAQVFAEKLLDIRYVSGLFGVGKGETLQELQETVQRECTLSECLSRLVDLYTY